MKKIFLFSLVAFLLPLNAFSLRGEDDYLEIKEGKMTVKYDFEIDGLYFVIVDDTDKQVEVYSYTEYEALDGCGPIAIRKDGDELKSRWINSEGTLVLPEKISHDGVEYTLVEIGTCSFQDRKEIKEVLLPSTVRDISSYAFDGCSNLVSLTLPENIESLGPEFIAGTSISEINVPAGIGTIWQRAFARSGIEKLVLNSDLPILDKPGMFKGCKHLKEFKIPASTKKIADECFYDAVEYDITIPESVTEIGCQSFAGNRTFRQLTLSANISRLYTGAFYECVNLWHLTFSKTPKCDNLLYEHTPMKLLRFVNREILRNLDEVFPHQYRLYEEPTYPMFEVPGTVSEDYRAKFREYFANYSRLDFGSNADDVELYLNPGADEYDDNPYAQLHEKATLLVPRDTPFKLAWKAAGEYIHELPYLNGVEIKDVERIGDMNVVTISGIKEDSKFFVKAINSKVESLTDESALYDIYSIDGMLLKSNVSDKELDTLPSGIYLLRGGDKTVKIIR